MPCCFYCPELAFEAWLGAQEHQRDAHEQLPAPPGLGGGLVPRIANKTCPDCGAIVVKSNGCANVGRMLGHRLKHGTVAPEEHHCTAVGADGVQCGATFGWAGTLKRHVRTMHEGARDHVCAVCGATFGKAGDLKRHVRSKHKDEDA